MSFCMTLEERFCTECPLPPFSPSNWPPTPRCLQRCLSRKAQTMSRSKKCCNILVLQGWIAGPLRWNYFLILPILGPSTLFAILDICADEFEFISKGFEVTPDYQLSSPFYEQLSKHFYSWFFAARPLWTFANMSLCSSKSGPFLFCAFESQSKACSTKSGSEAAAVNLTWYLSQRITKHKF